MQHRVLFNPNGLAGRGGVGAGTVIQSIRFDLARARTDFPTQQFQKLLPNRAVDCRNLQKRSGRGRSIREMRVAGWLVGNRDYTGTLAGTQTQNGERESVGTGSASH